MTSGCSVWDFRANHEYFTLEEIKTWLKNNCKKWAFQLEEGDKGYKHWQGRFSLMKKRRKNELWDLFKKLPNIPNYFEPTTKENQKNYFYVLKEDTRLEGPWTDTIENTNEDKYIPKQYRDLTLNTMQLQMKEICYQPCNIRRCDWIYDPIGNHGKSTFASLMQLHENCIDMPPCNDFNTIIQTTCNILMAKKMREPRALFFDLPRSFNQERLFGMISAFEQIKKGKVWDFRYNYTEWWFDSPAILCFANSLPEEGSLSKDRWHIWIIDNNKLIPYNNNPLDIIQ